MGLDGFSMSNLGLKRNLTSAQLSMDAEVTARQSLDSQIADVDGVGKKEKVGKKDADAAFNGMIPFIPDEEENESQQEQSNEPATQQLAAVEYEEDEEAPKYHFRFNANDMIEIWDSETNSIIKTITPEQAQKVICNLEDIPGVLVNKEI